MEVQFRAGRGCCLPSSAPGEQDIQEPLHARAWSEAVFSQSGSTPWRDKGRRGDATLMGGTGAESFSALERGKNQLSLGKRQRREYGEIKPDPVTGDH